MSDEQWRQHREPRACLMLAWGLVPHPWMLLGVLLAGWRVGSEACSCLHALLQHRMRKPSSKSTGWVWLCMMFLVSVKAVVAP